MKSNKQWLDELAATDPQALQAWFDAPHDAGEASIMSINAFIAEHDAPRADCEQVDGNHSKADSDDSNVTQKEPASLRDCFGILSDSPKSSKKLRNEQDSREQLEADIDRWAHSFNIADERHHSTRFYEDLRECMLDIAKRQAVITEREYANTRVNFAERLKFVSRIDELTRKLDNLSHDLAESERLREEMREELSVAYDHAHDLLARRDRGMA